MVGQPAAERSLDDFLEVPAFPGNVLVRPSAKHRGAYGVALLVGTLLAIIGLVSVAGVLLRDVHPASDTVSLAVSLGAVLIGLGLIWRFSTPFVFAIAASSAGLAWRNLFGWHHAPWQTVDFALVKRHSRFGGGEVHVKTSAGRMHFGWFDAVAGPSPGPLESLPADEARALLHTIVVRADLQRRETGVWVRESETPIEVSTGQVEW